MEKIRGENKKKRMKHFIIVVGGSIKDAFALEYMKKENPDFCIAADSGMNFFYRNGMQPDLIVGDFDSASTEALRYFQARGKIAWEKLNPIKDDTDTESAIRKAIALGAEKITLLGATGTRLDHVLGNIELLGLGMQSNVLIELVDEKNKVRMINSGIRIKREQQFGKYISLIPYTWEVTGLTLTGFKYPLKDAVLKGFCSLGVSNEITEPEAVISFQEGILIVIEARD